MASNIIMFNDIVNNENIFYTLQKEYRSITEDDYCYPYYIEKFESAGVKTANDIIMELCRINLDFYDTEWEKGYESYINNIAKKDKEKLFALLDFYSWFVEEYYIDDEVVSVFDYVFGDNPLIFVIAEGTFNIFDVILGELDFNSLKSENNKFYTRLVKIKNFIEDYSNIKGFGFTWYFTENYLLFDTECQCNVQNQVISLNDGILKKEAYTKNRIMNTFSAGGYILRLVANPDEITIGVIHFDGNKIISVQESDENTISNLIQSVLESPNAPIDLIELFNNACYVPISI